MSTNPGPAGTHGTSAMARAELAAAANPQSVLPAVDLTLSSGQRAVLRHICLDVHKGEVTALLGPTSSGKTTLLRTFDHMNNKVTGCWPSCC